MSIESPSHRPPLNQPARALVREFMANVYLGMSMQRDLEGLGADTYYYAESMLERAQLVLPDGSLRIEPGNRYVTPLGTAIAYTETLCPAPLKPDTRVHKRLDIEGLTDLHTMMGTAVYDRLVIVGYVPRVTPPCITQGNELIEKELAFFRKGAETPRTIYKYKPNGESIVVSLQEGTEAVPVGDLLLTLAIAETTLAQPLEQVTLPATV